MWRAVVIGVGTWGAWKAGKAAAGKIREHATSKSAKGNPMMILAKGATSVQDHIGPWRADDLTLGLAAMAKVTEKRPPPAPGQLAEEEMEDAEFLKKAQHWRSVAEAVYVPEAASFSLLSDVPESAIVAAQWQPDSDSLRPAYAICVDAVYGAVVLAVRGTSHPLDMLVDCGANPEKFQGGVAHGGYVHATEVLCKEVEQHIDRAFEVHGQEMKLVIVGHSMGASVGIMSALKLRDKYKDLECWGYSPSACLSLDLARECAGFATCFLGAHDLVPRFSLASVEQLRQQVYSFDWDEAERVAQGDEEWKNIKKSLEAMKSYQRAQKDLGDKVQKAQNSVGGTLEGTRQNLGKVAAGKDGCNEKQDKQNAGQNDDDASNQEEEKKEPPALFPPGKLYVLACDPPGCGKRPEQRPDVPELRNYGAYPTFDESQHCTWVLHRAKQEDFNTIIVSRWCISDHMLGTLQEGIYRLQQQCKPAADKLAS